MKNRIGIVDTGVANIGSLASALSEIGADYTVIQSKSKNAANCSHIILPGVGSFDSGMERLLAKNLDGMISSAASAGKPILGICLGMQLLCKSSQESSCATPGLSIFDSDVVKLQKNAEGFWPKIGWSSVNHIRQSAITDKIPSGEDFYFIHGFAMELGGYTVSESEFCHRYSSIVSSGNTFGVQFHPEKSQKSGLQLLKNFYHLKF